MFPEISGIPDINKQHSTNVFTVSLARGQN